jgi:hypothetical protein
MKLLIFLIVATVATVARAHPQKISDAIEQLMAVPAAIGEGLKSVGKDIIDSAVDSHRKVIGTVANVARGAEEIIPPPLSLKSILTQTKSDNP